MWENFAFLVIFDTCDVVYNWLICHLLYLIIYLHITKYYSLTIKGTIKPKRATKRYVNLNILEQLYTQKQNKSFEFSTLNITHSHNKNIYVVFSFFLSNKLNKRIISWKNSNKKWLYNCFICLNITILQINMYVETNSTKIISQKFILIIFNTS